MIQGHVILVDDEIEIRILLSEIWEDLGLDVTTAENG